MKVMNEFFEEAKKVKVIPVIVFHSTEEVVPVMDALKEGGGGICGNNFPHGMCAGSVVYGSGKIPRFLGRSRNNSERSAGTSSSKERRKIYCRPGFLAECMESLSGRRGSVSAWMCNADGDHAGSGLRDYCFEIFPCEYIRRD